MLGRDDRGGPLELEKIEGRVGNDRIDLAGIEQSLVADERGHRSGALFRRSAPQPFHGSKPRRGPRFKQNDEAQLLARQRTNL